MTTKTLHSLFDAMHHGKYDYEDFLSGDVATNYDVVTVKGRPVHRPNKKLKAYHSFLNAFLFEYLDVNERVVYSYRKGVNPHTVVSAHAGGRAFFQSDISNFFGSIDRNLVQASLVERSARVPIADLYEHVGRILDLTTTTDGRLAVGFSTSPLISNSCLKDFDDDMETYCSNAGLTYTRYSDDLVLSAGSREVLKGIDLEVDRLLQQHFAGKLRLNSAKSKFTSVGRKVKILGMVILPSGQVSVDMELKRRIEVLLHFYSRDREKFLNVVSNDLKGGIDQVSGYINYVNASDKPYLEKLRRKFGSTVVDSFLHKSAT